MLFRSRRENLPVATASAARVFCLPIFPDLEIETVDEICGLIKTAGAGA